MSPDWKTKSSPAHLEAPIEKKLDADLISKTFCSMSYLKSNLKHSEWLLIHEAILDLYHQHTVGDLRRAILFWSKRLIACEAMSFCDTRGGNDHIPWIELSHNADRVKQTLENNPHVAGAMVISDFGRDTFADRSFYLHLWNTAPKIPRSKKNPIHTVQQFADYHSAREFRNTELYAECYAPVDQEMWCAHPLQGGSFTVALARQKRPFQDKEIFCFDLLQPHIDTAYRRLLALSDARMPTIAHAEQLRSFGLTSRETEVLHWLVEGKTNPEIAMILKIGLATVKTHVLNIYNKLGCSTRTAAVRRFADLIGK